MKEMKKELKSLLLSSLTFLTSVFSVGLAGCGNDDSLHVINFRPEDKAFYDVVKEEFEKETGKKLVYECVDTESYANFLTSRLKANAVDVFGTEPANILSLNIFENMDVLDDLQYSDGTNLWEHITDFEAEQVTSDGKKYLAPLGSVNEVVYYRKDVMELINPAETFENGKYPTTWNEFVGSLNFFKQKENSAAIDGTILYGGKQGWPASMIAGTMEVGAVRQENPNFYLQLAKSEVTYDSPIYREYLTKLKEVCSFVGLKQAGQDYNLVPGKFSREKYAYMIDGSWSMAQILKANTSAEIGFFPLPANDDDSKNNVVPAKSGAAMCIAKSTKKRDLAKKFIEILYREDLYQQYVNMAMVMPAVKGVEVTTNKEIVDQIFAFPTILLVENMAIPGVPGTDYIRQITSDFIVSPGYSVDSAVKYINDPLLQRADNWQKKINLEPWFKRFYPTESRNDW